MRPTTEAHQDHIYGAGMFQSSEFLTDKTFPCLQFDSLSLQAAEEVQGDIWSWDLPVILNLGTGLSIHLCTSGVWSENLSYCLYLSNPLGFTVHFLLCYILLSHFKNSSEQLWQVREVRLQLEVLGVQLLIQILIFSMRVCVCVYVFSHSVIVSADSLGPVDCSPPGSSVHGILQARILEWGFHSLLQGIFLTQGSNPSLLHLHCKQILYHWAIGVPWSAYSLSSNLNRVSSIKWKKMKLPLLTNSYSGMCFWARQML